LFNDLKCFYLEKWVNIEGSWFYIQTPEAVKQTALSTKQFNSRIAKVAAGGDIFLYHRTGLSSCKWALTEYRVSTDVIT